MAKITITKCDRCGREYENAAPWAFTNGEKTFSIVETTHLLGCTPLIITLDLCDSCNDALRHFIRQRPVVVEDFDPTGNTRATLDVKKGIHNEKD